MARGITQRHLAVISRVAWQRMQSLRQPVDVRLASTRRVPFERARAGERVFFKLAGGPVAGAAVIRKADFVVLRNTTDFQRLQQRWQRRSIRSAAWWRARRQRRFASLLIYGQVKVFSPTFPVIKRDRRDWVLLRPPPAEQLGLRMEEDWASLQKAALRWAQYARMKGKRKDLLRALFAACEALRKNESAEYLYGEILLLLLVLAESAGYTLPAAFWRFYQDSRRDLHAYSFIS